MDTLTFEQWLEKYVPEGIDMVCTRKETREEWDGDKHPILRGLHYSVKIGRKGRKASFSTDYSKGIGHAKHLNAEYKRRYGKPLSTVKNFLPGFNDFFLKDSRLRDHKEQAPDSREILDCLASDISGVLDLQSFEDWASEYGYDADSRSAEKIYKACQETAGNMVRVFGREAVESLVYNVERL